MQQPSKLTLAEARRQGKLDQFIAEHENDAEGDRDAFDDTLISSVGTACFTGITSTQATTSYGDGANRMFHGKGGPPTWLSEWTERHPLDDHSLDRRHKLGQLPYLAKPL